MILGTSARLPSVTVRFCRPGPPHLCFDLEGHLTFAGTGRQTGSRPQQAWLRTLCHPSPAPVPVGRP